MTAKTKPLGDDFVAEVIMGQSPPSSTYNTKQLGLPFYQGKKEFGITHPTPEVYCSNPSKIAFKNDILMSVRAPVGVVNICSEKSCIGRGLAAIRASENTSYKYLYYYFKSRQRHIEDMGTGSTFKAISKTILQNIEIPLPPLKTQKQIAAVLDRADALIQARQRSIEKLDELIRSLFLEMFGDYLVKKSQCKWERISEVTSFIDYRGKTPPKTKKGVRLITAKNVKKGFVTLKPEEYIDESSYLQWLSRGQPKPNDVLFTTEAPLGNVALIPKYDKFVVGQRLITLQPHNNLKPEVLMYVLLNDVIQYEIFKRSTGSTVKGIRSKEFAKIEIPLFPYKLQKQFTKQIKAIESQKVIHQKSLNSLQALFDSLMQRAFNGELELNESAFSHPEESIAS